MRGVLVMMALVISSSALAVPDTHRTGGLLNGRAWADWSADVKLATVIGIYEGLAFANARHNDIFAPFRTKATFSEIVAEVDKLYASNAANRIIPVIRALMRGGMPAEIEAEIARALRTASETTDPQ